MRDTATTMRVLCSSFSPPFLAFVVALLFAVCPKARAQNDEAPLLLMYSGTPETNEEAISALGRVEDALATRGSAHLTSRDAHDRMEALSREPAATDTTDLDALAEEAHAALEHVAFGRSAAAKRSVEEVFRRAERALESLNRETRTARNVLDACLALVRSALIRADKESALAEAMRCRRLVPDVAPSEFLHPPTVTGMLAAADAQLQTLHIGQLSVESVPESGCATYINGRHLGITPFHLDRAAAGEYRVQVECSHAPARVHTVLLGEGPVALHVDSELDRAVRNESSPGFVYSHHSLEQHSSLRHARELAQSLGARSSWLLSVHASTLTITRVSTDASLPDARVQLPWTDSIGATDADLQRALDALQGLRLPVANTIEAASAGELASTFQLSAQRRAPGAPPVPAPPMIGPLSAEARPASIEHEGKKRWNRARAGVGLAFVGALLFSAGVAFEHAQRRADNALHALDLSDRAVSERDANQTLAALTAQYRHDGALRWLAAGGSAFLVAAVATAPALAGEQTSRVTWWGYATGASAAVLALWAGAEWSRNGDCALTFADGSCARIAHTAGRAGLLLAGAAPLLAVPITQLTRWWSGKPDAHVRVGIAPTRGGALLTLRKEFGRWPGETRLR